MFSYTNRFIFSIGHMEKTRNKNNMIMSLTISKIGKQSTTLYNTEKRLYLRNQTNKKQETASTNENDENKLK